MKIPTPRSVTTATDESLIVDNESQDEGQADIDDFLLVKPMSTGMKNATETRRQPTPMDKASATFDSAHLLAILLARDVHFGADFSRASPSRDCSLLNLLSLETVVSLDKL